jgi:hypothetical protein
MVVKGLANEVQYKQMLRTLLDINLVRTIVDPDDCRCASRHSLAGLSIRDESRVA